MPRLESQIEKLIPMHNNKRYAEIYLNCVLTLLKDYLFLLKEYDNGKLKIDLDRLKSIDFVEIKSNKKGKK